MADSDCASAPATISFTNDEEPPGSSLTSISMPGPFAPSRTVTRDRPAKREAVAVSRILSPPRRKTKRPVSNPLTAAYRRAFYPDVSDKDWNDWRWQSRHRIRSLAQFEQQLELSADERQALTEGGSMLPVGITPYYMRDRRAHV